MTIFKSEKQKMDKWYKKLETMRDSFVSQMEALGLEVSQSRNIKKSLLPTQETQTQVQDIMEQETAVTSVPPWWTGSSSKIIKVNSYVRHNFI